MTPAATANFASGCSPLPLDRHRIEEGLNDLGTLSPEPGITLDIEFEGTGRDGFQRLRAIATFLGEATPEFRRDAQATSVHGLAIRGLIPGRWHVVIQMVRQGRHESYDTEIDVPSVERHTLRVPLHQ